MQAHSHWFNTIFVMLFLTCTSCSDSVNPVVLQKVSAATIRNIFTDAAERDPRMLVGTIDTSDSPIALGEIAKFEMIFCNAARYGQDILEILASEELSESEQGVAALALNGLPERQWLGTAAKVGMLYSEKRISVVAMRLFFFAGYDWNSTAARHADNPDFAKILQDLAISPRTPDDLKVWINKDLLSMRAANWLSANSPISRRARCAVRR